MGILNLLKSKASHASKPELDASVSDHEIQKKALHTYDNSIYVIQ